MQAITSAVWPKPHNPLTKQLLPIPVQEQKNITESIDVFCVYNALLLLIYWKQEKKGQYMYSSVCVCSKLAENTTWYNLNTLRCTSSSNWYTVNHKPLQTHQGDDVNLTWILLKTPWHNVMKTHLHITWSLLSIRLRLN